MTKWVLVEFFKVSDSEIRVSGVIGDEGQPFNNEKEAMVTCEKWNKLFPSTHYEVYEIE